MEREKCPDEDLSQFGIDDAEMRRWFDRVALRYDDHPFPARRQTGSLYFYENRNFPLADALSLSTFLTELKPRTFIEIGSGFSSCTAIDTNERYFGGQIAMRFIDPFPEMFRSLIGDDHAYAPEDHGAKPSGGSA